MLTLNLNDIDTREVLDLIAQDPELSPVLKALENPAVYMVKGRINKTALARVLGVKAKIAHEWLVYLQHTVRRLSGDQDVDPIRPEVDLISTPT